MSIKVHTGPAVVIFCRLLGQTDRPLRDRSDFSIMAGCHPWHLWHSVSQCPWHWTLLSGHTFRFNKPLCHHILWRDSINATTNLYPWNLFRVSHDGLLQIPAPLLASWSLLPEMWYSWHMALTSNCQVHASAVCGMQTRRVMAEKLDFSAKEEDSVRIQTSRAQRQDKTGIRRIKRSFDAHWILTRWKSCSNKIMGAWDIECRLNVWGICNLSSMVSEIYSGFSCVPCLESNGSSLILPNTCQLAQKAFPP